MSVSIDVRPYVIPLQHHCRGIYMRSDLPDDDEWSTILNSKVGHPTNTWDQHRASSALPAPSPAPPPQKPTAHLVLSVDGLSWIDVCYRHGGLVYGVCCCWLGADHFVRINQLRRVNGRMGGATREKVRKWVAVAVAVANTSL
jgi:hypothetical protein